MAETSERRALPHVRSKRRAACSVVPTLRRFHETAQLFGRTSFAYMDHGRRKRDAAVALGVTCDA